MSAVSVKWDRLSGALIDLSKRWWGYAIICQIFIVAVNVYATLVHSRAQESAFVVGILTVIYTLLQWRHDRLKRVADSVKRKFEMLDGLGWPITPKEASDLLVSLPKSFRDKSQIELDADYFSSNQPKSPRRLMENLEESSWWTKHLSSSMTQFTASLCIVVFTIATVTLIISLQSSPDITTADAIARIITLIVVFMFSGGYFRLAFEYSRLSNEAEKIEDKAGLLLNKETITEVEAIKLLHDYQIARASAPSLPTWIWKVRQRSLNEVWKERVRISSE